MELNNLSLAVFALLTVDFFFVSQDVKAFSVVSETANVSLNSQLVSFTIEFSEVPDFFTVDFVGRAANSFQYFLNFRNGNFPFGIPSQEGSLDVLIRGEEIKISGDVRIRNAFPSSFPDDPNSGGWGSIRGSVPFLLNSKKLDFNVPLGILGDTDGLFTYDLETYEFGGMSSRIHGQKSHIVAVPEPLNVMGIPVALVFGILFKRRLNPKSKCNEQFSNAISKISQI
jgi:hypothetical protein